MNRELWPILERISVSLGELGASRVESVELWKLMNAERGLDIHHVELVSRFRDIIELLSHFAEAGPCLAVDAMKAKPLQLLVQRLVRKGDRASFARRHILVGVKREYLNVSAGSYPLTFVARSNGMGRVLDDANAASFGKVIEWIEVDWKACKMDGHNRPGSRADDFLHFGYVEVIGVCIHIC